MPRLKRVLLLIESSRAYGRGCLAGVAAYVRAHPHWHILHVERSLAEGPPSSLRRFGAHGVMARIETQEMATAIDRLKTPAVDLRGIYRPRGGGSLDTDPRACSQLAADHFLDRGFRHPAFCGYPGVNFSDQRCRFFVEYLEARGLTVEPFAPPRRDSRVLDTSARETDAELSEPDLDKWLKRLPKPVAVFACNDVRGRQVLASCARAGLTVPDDVAVLGVDNDEVICDLSTPPLSSIEPDTKRIGYQGSALLDRLMKGESPPKETIAIPPKGVRIRRSSDLVAVEDNDVAAALRLIRDHSCDGITVEVVARRVALSRSTLDRRFQRVLGRSPKAEINRIRVTYAKRLLMETDYNIATIATMTGYGAAPQFVTAFKRLTGFTPGKYRERSRTH